MDKIKFVVINENILGYIDQRQPDQAGVLASSILRGATHDWRDGPFPLRSDGKDIRPATIADFESFRVESIGYENDPEHYNFPTE